MNMSNSQQNKQVQNKIQSEIEQIKREINLLRDTLKQTKKRWNLFQNGLNLIEKIQTKKRQNGLK